MSVRYVLKGRGNEETVETFERLDLLQLWMKTKSPNNIEWRIVGPHILAGYRIFDSAPIIYMHIEEGEHGLLEAPETDGPTDSDR